jgi:AraC family transcriptional regulator
MAEFETQYLLQTTIMTVRAVCCRGTCRSRGAQECTDATHLVFPYRGLYLRHVGSDQAVADANHVLFFNRGQDYCVSHPVSGGDASLDLAVAEPVLRELVPAQLLNQGGALCFRHQHQRIDARAQVLVALLRHALQSGSIEPLEAESLALTLVCRSVGLRTSHACGASQVRRRLVDRVKVLLARDLARRWTLAEVAREIGGSPVYLTQVFQQVEGLPLYRYQLRLRLARALDLLTQYDDLSALAHDLGFSSHSHFTAAFRAAYGRSPSVFKQETRS